MGFSKTAGRGQPPYSISDIISWLIKFSSVIQCAGEKFPDPDAYMNPMKPSRSPDPYMKCINSDDNDSGSFEEPMHNSGDSFKIMIIQSCTLHNNRE